MIVSTSILLVVMGSAIILILSLYNQLSNNTRIHRYLQKHVKSIEEPVVCSLELNLYCPPQMKCCPQSIGATEVSRGQIPFVESKTMVGYNCLGASKGKYPVGECCNDMDGTGCSVGYICSAATAAATKEELTNAPHCSKDSSQRWVDNSGKTIEFNYDYMPRYHTCPAREYQSYAPFGLPIPTSAIKYHGRNLQEGFVGQLAYYTNKKSIHKYDTKIKTAIVTIHGSSRNSANYLCYMMRAVKDYVASVTSGSRLDVTTEQVSEEDYVVIAPWFMAPLDGEPASTSSLPFLQWDDENPIAHTFRYGAESLEVDGLTVSSFAAMDVLLETLCNKQSFPNLKNVVITGHSAGGQLVQRWGVSSNSWCFGVNNSNPHVKLVVVNPRSYAYLDGRRYFPTQIARGQDVFDPSFIIDDENINENKTTWELRELTLQEQEDCQEFNRYEWGLNENVELPAPYVINNIAAFEDVTNTKVFCRYASRDIVYLSGERDVEKLGDQICNEDGHQGPTRRQRSKRFYSSLQVIGQEIGYCRREEGDLNGDTIHERVVVYNVGHDHALMYISDEGQRVLFD